MFPLLIIGHLRVMEDVYGDRQSHMPRYHLDLGDDVWVHLQVRKLSESDNSNSNNGSSSSYNTTISESMQPDPFSLEGKLFALQHGQEVEVRITEIPSPVYERSSDGDVVASPDGTVQSRHATLHDIKPTTLGSKKPGNALSRRLGGDSSIVPLPSPSPPFSSPPPSPSQVPQVSYPKFLVLIIQVRI